MWTRKELKDKSKVSFKANYWKSVLVALIVLALFGGMSTVFSSTPSVPLLASPSAASSSHEPDNVNVEIKDGKVKVDVDDADGGSVHVNMDADDIDDLGEALSDFMEEKPDVHVNGFFGPGAVLVGLSLALLMLVVIAVGIAVYVFVFSPLEIGSMRFFVRNLNQHAEVKEVTYGYDNNYKEVVKTNFLRYLFIFLWGLLFIVPGIYKSYEYRMIPYLLAEDPAMTKDRAFAESKRMMDGQKWNAFVLDLSFLGWHILSWVTLGILGVFYVYPYQLQTNAALYEKLRYGLPAPAPEQVAQPAYAAPVYTAANPVANVQAQGQGQVQAQAQAQAQVMPVIVPQSQPPVPPFAQVGASLDDGVGATESQPESGIGVTAPQSANGLGTTEPLPENSLGTTSPQPKVDLGTTAPLPEPGIDPTASMPGVQESASASDSPKA